MARARACWYREWMSLNYRALCLLGLTLNVGGCGYDEAVHGEPESCLVPTTPEGLLVTRNPSAVMCSPRPLGECKLYQLHEELWHECPCAQHNLDEVCSPVDHAGEAVGGCACPIPKLEGAQELWCQNEAVPQHGAVGYCLVGETYGDSVLADDGLGPSGAGAGEAVATDDFCEIAGIRLVGVTVPADAHLSIICNGY